MKPFVKKVSEKEQITCQFGKEDCWELATIYIEGGFYCKKHGDKVLEILKKL